MLANVRERMLSLGDEAGLHRLKLSSCVDSKAFTESHRGVRKGSYGARCKRNAHIYCQWQVRR